VRANRRLLVRHLGAFAAFSAIAYGVLAWAPSYFIRGFGWTASQFGLVFGLAFAIPSVAGTILGGWWSSRLRRAGQVDANFRLMIWGLAGVGLPAALAPVVPSPGLAMTLYAVVAFCLSFPTGCSAAAVQDYTPPQLRGRVTALYYTAVSLGGVGLGPLVVGALTDYVFRAEGLVGRSLAVSGALFGAAAFGLAVAAAREFRRRAAAAPETFPA
jgi:MFS family permease